MTAILGTPARSRECDTAGCRQTSGYTRHARGCVNSRARRLNPAELHRLRALVGLPPEGPTPEQRARWITEEQADELGEVAS